ncbi:MAG: helix-turn-helix domain-containing protein [Oscillospiraceae bacterium]|jgi:transcriptional regulator with XRE-family HTH domain|nr:helix-turn-helix domain-containing protein [Oscillospiraceae bacterium]
MHYVSLLRKLRKKNGLTQQQVADYLHLDRSTYAYYESGRTKINIDILIRLAHFFQVGLGLLVGEEHPDELADGTDSDAFLINDSVSRFNQLTREEQHLIILFRSGTAAQQKQVLAQANALTTYEKSAE